MPSTSHRSFISTFTASTRCSTARAGSTRFAGGPPTAASPASRSPTMASCSARSSSTTTRANTASSRSSAAKRTSRRAGAFDRSVRDEAHVTLLAADDEGYKNLTALISKGFLEGYYYKPRIDMELLEKHNRGLIVLSGCMSGLVAAPLLKNDRATSLKDAQTFTQIFGDRFYIELMRHGMPEEDVDQRRPDRGRPRARTCRWWRPTTRITSRKGDAQAHDVLLCIGTGKTVADTSRMKFFSDEFYVKSARTRCASSSPTSPRPATTRSRSSSAST